MATGSGKTLILHLNYYQFQHYMPRLDEAPDNILLITPNAGLTHQHQKELNASGIPNRYYLDADGGTGIEPETVKLIEITKLTDEKKGDGDRDRKSTRLNSSNVANSYAVFCLKKKNNKLQ